MRVATGDIYPTSLSMSSSVTHHSTSPFVRYDLIQVKYTQILQTVFALSLDTLR